MNNKKSQAAMEFLMTYGWAILIVLIVLAVLFALGVFNPDSGGSRCKADLPFGCVDVKLTAGGGGDEMKVDASGDVSGTPTFGSYSGTCTVATWSGTFTSNSRNTITLACPDSTAGSSFSGSFDIIYTSASSGLSHNSRVTYSGSYE